MGKKMDLVCYLSNSFPSQQKTLENAAIYENNGCDIIEIDLPTNNPFLDGKLLQKRMISSYKADPSLEMHIDTIYKIRNNHPLQRMVLLAYTSTIKEIGIQRLKTIYNDNNLEGVILVGNNDKHLVNSLLEKDIVVIPYIRLNLPKEDLCNAKNCNGFIYLQASDSDRIHLERLIGAINALKNADFANRKIYCGVGIKSAYDIETIKQSNSDGVFVGSSVFTLENDGAMMGDFIKKLKDKC
ncbi:tryptophan synthase subunit alpha [Tuanshanicoccus lijuaniae]|uniref:tryptophan synthase subunit alpha n=1 Tax=Aerococcaceae bacterium zg-1292 TaxID=2774330 RepID=UPI00193587D3|nr:tryptophan synthase subunit alpha [Aerococcaceae bacterium zg-1292]QQA36607.1 tryptophan synthase subunit alpha [Aerococcaceae bacterium zg-1292]